MLANETLHERHEYGCGRGLFYDLDCSCWDGPRVTEADLKDRAAGRPAVARFDPNDSKVSRMSVVLTPPR